MSLVTVYLVCNNHGEFVRQSVQSILDQTYPQIELIAFDNGSTDDSRAVLRELSSAHGFRLIEQENVGLVATIDAAYSMASGEYVIRLDADDWLEPEAIARLVEPLGAAPDIAMSFPDYYEVAADGRILRRIRRRSFSDDVTLLDQPAHGAVTLTRKTAYFAVGGVDLSLTAQDGVDLWLKVIQKYRVKNVPEALFNYRRHDSNLTGDVTRILRQRYDIFRTQSGPVDPSTYLGVIVLPKSKGSRDLFVRRKFGERSLLQRALGKLEQSEICRSAIVVCAQDMAEAVGDVIDGSTIDVSVHPTSQTANGYTHVARLVQGFSGVEDLIFISPQNPFMHLNYVDAMIHYKSIFGVSSVHSCVLDNHLMFQHDGTSLVLFNDGKERKERDTIIRKAGGLMLVNAADFARSGHGLTAPIGHVEIDEISSFEISSPISIEAANALATVW